MTAAGASITPPTGGGGFYNTTDRGGGFYNTTDTDPLLTCIVTVPIASKPQTDSG